MRRISLVPLAAAAGFLAASPVHAQPTPARSAFEVASIKLNKDCDPRRAKCSPSPDRFTQTCTSLRNFIKPAYGIFLNGSTTPNTRGLQVLGGPAWLESDLYDIEAGAAGNIPPSAG